MEGIERMDDLPDQFRSHIRVTESGCWEWTGSTSQGGYGRVRYRGSMQQAHRVCYELLIGSIPEELTVDHLCRNTTCVNPAHLEVVSMRENLLRSNGVGGVNARKTHCPKGHPYSPENTYRVKGGHRRCRTCVRERWMVSERRRRHLQASAQRRAEQTTCKRGHLYPSEMLPDPNKPRICMICVKLSEKKWDAIKRINRDAQWRAAHGIAPEAPLTYRDKVLLGHSITAQHAQATQCPQGHPYDENNTYISRGRRHCRACHAAREAGRRARSKDRKEV